MSASQAGSQNEQRRESEREKKDEDALARVARLWRAVSADAAADTAAVNAAREAWRASKDVVAATQLRFEPEEKQLLRAKRDRLERDAQEARCQCPSTCVLGGV